MRNKSTKINVNARYLSETPWRLRLSSINPVIDNPLYDPDDPDSGISPTIRTSVDFPIGPQTLAHGMEARKFSELSRPFEKPLLVSQNNQLRTVQFSALLADLNTGGTSPVEEHLSTLDLFARDSVLCTLHYGIKTLDFNVVIVKLDKRVTQRDSEGRPVRVLTDITLKEAVVLDTRMVEFKAVVFYDPVTVPPPPRDDEPAVVPVDFDLQPDQVDNYWYPGEEFTGLPGTNTP